MYTVGIKQNVKLYRKFARLENKFKELNEDLEFFIYEDFNIDNPDDIFYRMDMLSSTICLGTMTSKDVNEIYSFLKGMYDKLKCKFM